jgi:serine/threonine protein kinase/tetratricopeptide (TPR) repeat protein
MGNDMHSDETTDAVLGQEQVDGLTLQFRAACLAALSSGQSLDVEAVLRAVLRTPGSHPPRQQEVRTDTKDSEPRPNNATPTTVKDAVNPTISLAPSPGPDTGKGPAGQGATLDYASSPADANATQDLHRQSKASFSLAGDVQSSRGSAPDSFAGYEILGVLGKGGMGVVYKARQRSLKRIVALKMIRRDDASESDLARFRIEAEAVAQLKHPNIVQVYEVGEDAGRPYLALEYVDGGSLKEKLAGKPQPVLHAAQLLQLLAWGMSAAHRQGIIHRDLKPANVMLMGRCEGSTELRNDTTVLVEELYGAPKITDFGLAKRLEEDDGQTRSGSILGTPSYMAPEQAMGRIREVGPLADQYALGAMLYEMLTGRPPFASATILETLEQVRTQEPVPPSHLQPKVPRDLETICLKCLQKEPQKRYADCAALAEDLRRFVAGDPIVARPVSAPERLWRWCRRNPKVAGLSGSLMLLLFAILVVLLVFNVKLAEEKAQTKRERDAAIDARNLAEEKKQEALDQRGLALSTLGDLVTNVQAEIGKLRGQQDLQKKLLKIAMDSLKRVSENPAAKISLKDSTLAAAHYGMGAIYEGLGETGPADEEYRLAEAAYAEQVNADPDNAKCRANQALALMALGRVNLKRPGGSDEVRGFFGKAADVLATVDHGRPGDQLTPRDIRELRADAVHWLGVLVIDRSPREGRDHYEREVKLREEVADLTRIEVLQYDGITSVGLLAAPLGQGPLLVLAAPIAMQRRIDDALGKLANSYLFLGGAELKLNNLAATEVLYLKALKLSQAKADAHPEDVNGLWTLAAARERLGDFYLRSKRPELAGKEYDVAAQIFQDLGIRDPNRVAHKDNLSRLLYSVATAALQRGEPALAAEKYRASRDIREARTRGLTEGSAYREYMVTLARCGEYQRAAQMAGRVRDTSGKDLNGLIDVACCFAICSDMVAPNKRAEDLTAEQSRLREDFAGRAVEALRAALALGYRNVYNLETEPDLDAVRDRPGFKALLDELNRSPGK